MKRDFFIVLSVFVFISFISMNVFAEDTVPENRKYCAGAGLGFSLYEKGGTGLGIPISLGYQIKKDLIIELAYVNQGKAEESYTENDDGVDHKGTQSMEASGPMISLLGFHPLNEKFDIYGRVGLYIWEGEYKDKWDTGETWYGGSDEGSDAVFGFGLKSRLNEKTDWLLEFTAIKLKDFSANMIRAGVLYYFN